MLVEIVAPFDVFEAHQPVLETHSTHFLELIPVEDVPPGVASREDPVDVPRQQPPRRVQEYVCVSNLQAQDNEFFQGPPVFFSRQQKKHQGVHASVRDVIPRA